MADRALYFPYINVPDRAWFTRVLLYWDEVGSIVPSDFISRPDELSSHMRTLVQEGLVRQVIPAQYVHAAPAFEETFLQFLDAHDGLRQSSPPTPPSGRCMRIHMQKLGDLPEELVRRGIARRGNDAWYEVESEVGKHFMAYLAGVIGQMERPNYVPVTEEKVNLAAFGLPPSTGVEQSLASLRVLILDDLLPAPVEPPSASALRSFKERFGAQLTRFRARLETELTGLATLPAGEARELRIRNVRRQLREEVDEIQSRLRERRWGRIVFGRLCAVVGAAVPALQSAVSGDMLTGVAAVTSLAGAVYVAAHGTEARAAVLERPLAYAALARERLH